MIEINKLRVAREEATVCEVDQLTVGTGERLAVIGSNGSGKTTLLRVMAGLTNDYSGQCLVACKRRTYVHQQPYLFRGTALANARYRAWQGKEKWPSAGEWLQRLGVAHLSDHRVSTLSGGEVRRVALARALATRPELLLVDEPLADLDEEAKEQVWETFDELTEMTLVIASPTELPVEMTKTIRLGGKQS